MPASASVQPNAPIFSPFASGVRYFSFCFSVPYSEIGQEQREVCADIITPVEAQPFESSSTAVIYVKLSSPSPPYFFSKGIPIIPF